MYTNTCFGNVRSSISAKEATPIVNLKFIDTDEKKRI